MSEKQILINCGKTNAERLVGGGSRSQQKRRTVFVVGLSKKKWAALIILNLQENSNLLKFKYEQRRKR